MDLHCFITVRKRSCKVMLSHLSVSHSVHMGWACVAAGHAWQGWRVWQGGICGRGCAWRGSMCGRGTCVAGGGRVWQGACMAGGMCGRVWQERRPLQRTVRILLECIIVVYNCKCRYMIKRMISVHLSIQFIHQFINQDSAMLQSCTEGSP